MERKTAQRRNSANQPRKVPNASVANSRCMTRFLHRLRTSELGSHEYRDWMDGGEPPSNGQSSCAHSCFLPAAEPFSRGIFEVARSLTSALKRVHVELEYPSASCASRADLAPLSRMKRIDAARAARYRPLHRRPVHFASSPRHTRTFIAWSAGRTAASHRPISRSEPLELVYCNGKREGDWPCHHHGELRIDQFSAEETLSEIQRRCRGTVCGCRPADPRPDYSSSKQRCTVAGGPP